MKVVLDTCMPMSVRDALLAAGHVVEWIGDWAQDPGDSAILAHCVREQAVLITLDKDFGELAIVFEQPHCGLIRLVGFPLHLIANTALWVLQQYADVLQRLPILTVEPGRVRVRLKEEELA